MEFEARNMKKEANELTFIKQVEGQLARIKMEYDASIV